MPAPALAVLAVSVGLLAGCGGGAAPQAGPTETGRAEPPPPAPPDVGRVVCDEEGTRVETPTVRPQRDGVHVQIVNDTAEDRSLDVDGPGLGAGMGAPPGTSTVVLDLYPGSASFSCADRNEERGTRPSGTLEVVDDEGVFVPPPEPPDCASWTVFNPSRPQGARGVPDPLAAAREAVAGELEPGDVVEQAGYPEADQPLYVLVRDGETIGTVTLFDDGAGGWLVHSVGTCTSA